MQLLKLQKLLQKINPKSSQRQKESSEAISEHPTTTGERGSEEMIDKETKTSYEIQAEDDSSAEEICSDQQSEAELQDDLEEEKADLAEAAIPPARATKAHLTSSVPRSAGMPAGSMSRSELREARELFCGLDDKEIHRLYKRVTQ